MKETLITSKLSSFGNSKTGILVLLFVLLGMATTSCSKSTAGRDELKVDKIVSGIILSPDKKPIPGAVIIIKDTTTGTVTDIKGNFSMDLKEFEEATVTLKISMIDYESKEVEVKTNKLPTDLGKIILQKETD